MEGDIQQDVAKKIDTVPWEGSFFTIIDAADGSIVMGGLRGRMFRTADSGATWTAVKKPLTSAIVDSTRLADGRLVAVGIGGEVLMSTDNGVSFAALPVTGRGQLYTDGWSNLRRCGRPSGDSAGRWPQRNQQSQITAITDIGEPVMAHGTTLTDLPVISNLSQFDEQSGNFLENLVFNHRRTVLVLCALVTLVLGYQATKIQLQAGFEKTLPKAHPYVLNYRANKNELKGLGNNLRIVVAVKEGTIFTPENLKFLETVNDEIFFIPGVDRNGMKSLFTPNTRWRVVTEEGFEGGPVIPGDFDPTSPKSIGAGTAQHGPRRHPRRPDCQRSEIHDHYRAAAGS